MEPHELPPSPDQIELAARDVIDALQIPLGLQVPPPPGVEMQREFSTYGIGQCEDCGNPEIVKFGMDGPRKLLHLDEDWNENDTQALLRGIALGYAEGMRDAVSIQQRGGTIMPMLTMGFGNEVREPHRDEL